MPSTFPGMNPYLESPDSWPTVHNRLIVGLADILTPRPLPKYQVDIDKRVYEVMGFNNGTALVGVAKVPIKVILPLSGDTEGIGFCRGPVLSVVTETEGIA